MVRINLLHSLKKEKTTGLDSYVVQNARLHTRYISWFDKGTFQQLPGNGEISDRMGHFAYYPNTQKGSTSDPNNYHGILLLQCLAKFFSSVLQSRILDWALQKNILSRGQLGFLPGNRTSDALIILHNLIDKYCHKNGKVIHACFIDFQKAFDTIPRDRLSKKS